MLALKNIKANFIFLTRLFVYLQMYMFADIIVKNVEWQAKRLEPIKKLVSSA